MTVIWRFIHSDEVQVGALALLIMSAWAVFLAAAYNDQKALQQIHPRQWNWCTMNAADQWVDTATKRPTAEDGDSEHGLVLTFMPYARSYPITTLRELEAQVALYADEHWASR